MLGKAKFKDFSAFSQWYIENAVKWNKENHDTINENIYPHPVGENRDKQLSKLFYNQFHVDTFFYSHSTPEEKKQCETDKSTKVLKKMEPILSYMSEFNSTWELQEVYDTPECAIISFGITEFIVPQYQKWLNIEYLKDYSNVNLHQLKTLSSAEESMTLIPSSADASLTSCSLNDTISDKKSAVAKLMQEMEDVKDAKNGELAELQKEIDEKIACLNKKKEKALSILQQKKAEMDLMIEKLETQLFVLESEIYGIRCFLGEVIDFAQLTKGLPEKEETPIVLFQKLRYLDEELGRMASIYDVEWSDHNLFEQLIANDPFALETFCPTRKCVSIVRLSKSGRFLQDHEIWTNMLKSCELLHGRKIGILVRNGDNVYIGWTDEEYICISDDLFYTPEVKEVESDGQSTKEEVASRYFIFSILQGLLENSKIISLPEKQSFLRPSKYIIFSAAENWLSDNRFGNFGDLVKKCNVQIREGDTILTVQRLRPGFDLYNRSCNDRGRGWRDRTHDVSSKDCTLYPINLVEEEVKYNARYEKIEGDYSYYTSSVYDENSDVPKPHKGYEFVGIEKKTRLHYFISLSKQYSLSGTARANFEVYSDEFINLTFMNSVWLHNAVINKNLGDWRIGGKDVDYAYAIKYLKTALDFVKKREETEMENIKKFYPALSDITEWQILLTEWKMEHNVHHITEYQAKRFAKTLK